MLKKIIWTIILLAPVLFVGIANWAGLSSDTLGAFNSSNMIDSWKSAISQIIDVSNEDTDTMEIINLVFLIVLALFWTAPFWYVWKGTFIVGWIPNIGFVSRIILILILIFLPGLISTLGVSNGLITEQLADEISYGFSFGILILALLGLWIKS